MTPQNLTAANLLWLQDRLTQGVLFRRVLAWIFDAFILGGIGFLLWLFCFTFAVATFGYGTPIFGVLAFLPLLYAWLCILTPMQASFGQALFGLRVVRNDDLGPADSVQAFVYALLYCVTMAAGLIWVAVALVTTRHRTLHDMLSGLVVVRSSALETYLTEAPQG